MFSSIFPRTNWQVLRDDGVNTQTFSPLGHLEQIYGVSNLRVSRYSLVKQSSFITVKHISVLPIYR